MFRHVTDEEVVDLANQVGRKMAREYPGVDPSDIASEALVRLAGKADKLFEKSKGYIYRVLERDAGAYAAAVRYDYVVSTSQYVYTPREIKALLSEVYFDPTAWDVPKGHDDRLSAEIDGRSIGIALMDMREAMDRIKPEYKKALEDKFFHEKDLHRQKVATAVEALTRSVNRIAVKTGYGDNCPGARKVMSNAKARYVTQAEMGHETNPYEEDALSKLQKLRKQEKSDPPGTHYNWSKYSN